MDEIHVTTSRYQGLWIPRPSGPFLLEEALAFVASRGVDVSDEFQWFVAEAEGLTLREAGLEWQEGNGAGSADAIYFRMRLDPYNARTRIQWKALRTESGTTSIFLREEVLASADHTLYVVSHELFELRALRLVFEQRGDAMTLRELADLIEPQLGGPIHQDAVRHSDELVRRFRVEGGFAP